MSPTTGEANTCWPARVSGAGRAWHDERVTGSPHEDLAYRSAGDLLVDLTARRISSVETMALLTERIDALDRPNGDDGLNALIDRLADAGDEARRCDDERMRGEAVGPLHGLPVVVKDNVEVRGGRATAGSLALADRTLPDDAPLVSRLRNAGAIVIATTNLSEWANIRSGNSSSGWSAVGGQCANPWDRSRSPGGSSSGSGVAVAAGYVPLAVGTETDGSITCPASLNGVVGIKPTVGAVPTRRVVPISSSQDSPGPLARRVADAALMLSVMADDADLVQRSTAIDVSALRLGLVDQWATGDDHTDRLAFESVSSIARKFARVVRVDGKAATDAVQADEFFVLLSELRTLLDDYLSTRPDSAVRSLRDVVDFNQRNADRELALFGQEFFEQASSTDGMRTVEYLEARRRNVEWANACFAPLWEDFDVLVAPAYAPAWTTDYAKGHSEARGGAVTTPAAILGLPIVTIPCGLVNGLPVGVSFVGRAQSEAVLIAVASVVEASLGLAGDDSFRPRDLGGKR